jgi:hypothetical protein
MTLDIKFSLLSLAASNDIPGISGSYCTMIFKSKKKNGGENWWKWHENTRNHRSHNMIGLDCVFND